MDENILDEKFIKKQEKSPRPTLRNNTIEKIEKLLLGFIFMISILCLSFNFSIDYLGQTIIDTLEGLWAIVFVPLAYLIRWKKTSLEIDSKKKIKKLNRKKMPVLKFFLILNTLLLFFLGFSWFGDLCLQLIRKGIKAKGIFSLTGSIVGSFSLFTFGLLNFYYLRITGQQWSKLEAYISNLKK